MNESTEMFLCICYTSCGFERDFVSNKLGAKSGANNSIVDLVATRKFEHVMVPQMANANNKHALPSIDPLQTYRRRHGAGPLDAAGDLVANGWPRPVVTGPDSPVTEFIPALRTV